MLHVTMLTKKITGHCKLWLRTIHFGDSYCKTHLTYRCSEIGENKRKPSELKITLNYTISLPMVPSLHIKGFLIVFFPSNSSF